MANCQISHLVLTISLDLTKSSEVRKAGDRSNCKKDTFFVALFFPFIKHCMSTNATLSQIAFFLCIGICNRAMLYVAVI